MHEKIFKKCKKNKCCVKYVSDYGSRMEVLTTRNGFQHIVYKGYIYHKRTTQCQRAFWICKFRSCKGKITTHVNVKTGDFPYRISGFHDHSPHVAYGK